MQKNSYICAKNFKHFISDVFWIWLCYFCFSKTLVNLSLRSSFIFLYFIFFCIPFLIYIYICIVYIFMHCRQPWSLSLIFCSSERSWYHLQVFFKPLFVFLIIFSWWTFKNFYTRKKDYKKNVVKYGLRLILFKSFITIKSFETPKNNMKIN